MKILVSACLLGENCKYNGGNNFAPAVAEYVKDKEEYAFLQDKHFAQGDVVCTNILCADGSLITLKLYMRHPGANAGKFLAVFTVFNLIDLATLLFVSLI